MTTLLEVMASDINDDRVFYDTRQGFAKTIGYAGGDFVGIFENDFQQLDADGFVSVASSSPAVWCRNADAPAVGQTITVDAVDYVITAHHPNYDGETLLILRSA